MSNHVHCGKPLRPCVWDSYPLAKEAWGNLRDLHDSNRAGHTISVRKLSNPYMPNDHAIAYAPAEGVESMFFKNLGVRDFYIPTKADMELVERLFPDLTDASNPSWPQVEARLIVAGQDREKLATYNAPTLLLLLSKAEGKNSGGDGGASVRKPGRPADTDAKEDKRIFNAWETGRYKTYADLAREFGKTKQDVTLAVNRHTKRESRRTK